MKKMLLSTICLLTMFAINFSANAGILLEPYAGMHLASKVKSSGSSSSDLKGSAFGGRLGFQNLGLMLGLNYKTGTATIGEDELDYDFSHQGFFIGYDFPIMFRVWAEMVFSGNAKRKSGGVTTEYKKISGTQLGLGYKIIPFVSLNLEIGSTKWKDGTAKTGAISVDAPETDITTYFLSISVPI